MSKNKNKNKSKYQKIFAATAAVSIVSLSINPISGIFANTAPASATLNGVNYSLLNGTYQVSSIVNPDATTAIIIPAKINGVNVTSIGNWAFNHSEAISINFEKPENITSIGDYSFYNVAATNNLSLPNITSVPKYGLTGADFNQINLDSNKITSIGSNSFYNTKATNSISLPNITSIPDDAFHLSNFNEIILDSNKVTSIGSYSFADSKAINKLSLLNITTVPSGAFYGSNFSEINLDSNKVTSISSESFYNAKATNSISLLNITTVPGNAFYGSFFSGIYLNSSKVTSISSSAFQNSKATNSISLLNITTVPSSAFNNSNFSEIHLDDSKVKTINLNSFAKAKAKNGLSLTSLTSVPNAFSNSSFSEINVDWSKVTTYNDGILTAGTINSTTNNVDKTITVKPNYQLAPQKITYQILKSTTLNGSYSPYGNIIELPVNKNGETIQIPDEPGFYKVKTNLVYPTIATKYNMTNTSNEVQILANSAPIITNNIPEQTFTGKGKTVDIDLSVYFDDLDNDALTYSVSSNVANKVTHSINDNVLTLSSVDKGSVIITVTARDIKGETVSQSFTTNVNIPVPIVKETIPSQTIAGVKHFNELDLSNYFKDLDGNPLVYKVSSNKEGVVDYLINNNKLVLNGTAKGSTNITVTAENVEGEVTTQTFTTTVNNTQPIFNTNFENLTLKPNEYSQKILLESSDLDNDTLTYMSTSSDNKIVKTTIIGNELIVYGLTEGSAIIEVIVSDGDGYSELVRKTFTVNVIEPGPIGPSEPIIDMDNTGDKSNGLIDLEDYFQDENLSDLIYTSTILINEPDADVFIKDNVLVIKNPKRDGLVSVEVEVMNSKGKKTVATFNYYVKLNKENVSDKKATLKLEEGEFTLITSNIDSFGKVKLTAAKQTVTSNFMNDFGVIDARGTQEGWHVTVSATPFTVETFNGFVGIPHELPIGSFALNNPKNIERIGHVNKTDGLPTSKINDYTVIDNGAIPLLNANQGEGLGEFKFNFESGLALTLDALTAKIDKVNYPDQNTPYVSTVTWDLITGP